MMGRDNLDGDDLDECADDLCDGCDAFVEDCTCDDDDDEGWRGGGYKRGY